MVNRTVTGAHYGLRDWLAQRVTAVIMAVYTVVVFVVRIGQNSKIDVAVGANHRRARTLVRHDRLVAGGGVV